MSTLTYTSENVIWQENGYPLEFGDDVLLSINQTLFPTLPTTIKGVFIAPYDEATPLVYNFSYDDATAGILTQCHVSSVAHYGCCAQQTVRLDSLIAHLGLTESSDGTFS